jgi:hypothetical protein
MGLRFLPLAILLCGPASRGLAGQAQQTAPDAGTRQRRAPPLSAEDEELVKQLALLEDVDLVRNLDLFEERSADPTIDAGTPDAGTAPPPAPPEPRP